MITHEFDRDRLVVRALLRGEVSDAEAVGWFEALVGELQGLRAVRGLVDTRPLEELSVTRAGINRLITLADENDDIFAVSRWAVVADRDAVYGMARVYELLRDRASYEVRVFRSLEDGTAWVLDPGV